MRSASGCAWPIISCTAARPQFLCKPLQDPLLLNNIYCPLQVHMKALCFCIFKVCHIVLPQPFSIDSTECHGVLIADGMSVLQLRTSIGNMPNVHGLLLLLYKVSDYQKS